MSVTLIVALLLSAAVAVQLFAKRTRWWLPMILLYLAVAVLFWLLYLEIIPGFLPESTPLDGGAP